MRVRIRRFAKLRSRGEPWNSQPVEVLLRQHDVNRVRRMVPPPPAANSHPPREILRGSALAKLRVRSLGRLPVLQVDLPQPMSYPFVQIPKDLRRLSHPKIRPPAREVPTQLLDD